MKIKQIDQHFHSTASDGRYSPEKLMALCRGTIDIASLTDHDTTKGLEPAASRAEELGIKFIPGIELTTQYGGLIIHIIGYSICYKDGDLEEQLRGIQETRTELVRNIIKRAHTEGRWEYIDFEEFQKAVAANFPYNAYLSKAHVALELFSKGNEFDSVGEALIAVEKASVYDASKESDVMPIKQGMDLLIKYGAKISLPHINKLQASDAEEERIVRESMGMGLTALESISSKYDDWEIVKYLKLAKKYNLCITAGSDFHGPEITQGIKLGVDLNSILTKDIIGGAEMEPEEIYEMLLVDDHQLL